MSHTLANLRKVLGKPVPWAKECAERAPLVHKITNMKDCRLVSALTVGAFPDPATIRRQGGKDRDLNRKPAIYFFVGCLFPNGGAKNAFVLGPDADSQLSGKGTPFDSGGLLDRHCLAREKSRSDKKRYLINHECDLKDFREYFAFLVSAVFSAM